MLVESFKKILSSTDWNDVLGKTITDESYDQFIKTFNLIYDGCFPIKAKEIKTKNLPSPSVTKGIKKSSKRKQKLYEKFLKKKSQKMKKNTKIISNYLKRLKKIPRKSNFKKNVAFVKAILKIHGKL